jgi:hypothetical protein
MMQTHLVRFIESVISEPNTAAGSLKSEPAPMRPLVALVEDDIFMTEAWEEALRPDTECVVFGEPAAFRKRFEGDPAFQERLSAIILDPHFEGTTETGADLAGSLRGRTSARILFGSDATLLGDEKALFDGVCGKRPVPWSQLSSSWSDGLASKPFVLAR